MLPAHLETETEADGTVLAQPPGEQSMCLRFTVITARKAVPNPMLEHVRDNAQQAGRQAVIAGRRAIDHYEESVEEDGQRYAMHYWEIGEDQTLVVVSAMILDGLEDDPRVTEILAAMPAVLDSLMLAPRSVGEQPRATTSIAESTPQAVREFGDRERTWLRAGLERVQPLVRHSGREFDDPFDPRALDRVFTQWTHTDPRRRLPASDVSHALGCAFGEYCVKQLGMRWVVVTDEYGTSFAIRHEVGETMAYPVDSVMKRTESGQTDFLPAIYSGLRERIAQAEAEGSK